MFKLALYVNDRNLHLLFTSYEVRGWEDRNMLSLSHNLSRSNINLRNPLNLITEELNTNGLLASRGREYLNNIPSNTEVTSREADIISLILDIH